MALKRRKRRRGEVTKISQDFHIELVLLPKLSGEGLDNLDDLTEALPEEEEAVKDDDDDMDFNDDSFADKKKKKKKKKVNVEDLDDGDADKVCFEWSTYPSGLDFKHIKIDFPSHEAPFYPQENEGEGDSADPWTGSDRDYLYDELLQVNFHNRAETSDNLSRRGVSNNLESKAYSSSFRECLE